MGPRPRSKNRDGGVPPHREPTSKTVIDSRLGLFPPPPGTDAAPKKYRKQGYSGRAPPPPTILYDERDWRRAPPGSPCASQLSPPPEAIPEVSTESESASEPPRGRHCHQRAEGRTPRPRTRSSDTLPIWDRRGSQENAQEQKNDRSSGRPREDETRPTSSPVRAVTPEELRMHPGTAIAENDAIWAPRYKSHLHYADRGSRHRSVQHEDPAHSPSDTDEGSLTALPPMPHHNHEALIPLEKARAKVRKNPSRYRATSSRPNRRRWWMWLIAGFAVRLLLSRSDQNEQGTDLHVYVDSLSS